MFINNLKGFAIQVLPQFTFVTGTENILMIIEPLGSTTKQRKNL